MKTLRNRVQLIGNLGKDPEIIEFDNGKLAKISIATRESFKNSKGEKVSNTHWHNLIAWGFNANFIEKYLRKGDEIAIEGHLTTREFEDKERRKRSSTEIVIGELLIIKTKRENAA